MPCYVKERAKRGGRFHASLLFLDPRGNFLEKDAESSVSWSGHRQPTSGTPVLSFLSILIMDILAA